VRKVEPHMPSDGKITRPRRPLVQVPNRALASRMPCGFMLSSMKASMADDGSFRRKICPSTETVSYSPSGSFSACGVRSASAFGKRDCHRSSGSRKWSRRIRQIMLIGLHGSVAHSNDAS